MRDQLDGHQLYFRGKGVFVGAAFIAIGVFMIVTVSQEWWTGMQSRNWTPTEAVVTVAAEKQGTSHGSEGRVYSVKELDFLYRYQVDGKPYTSSELSFTKKEVAVRDIPAFVAAHPAGRKLTVYVNPDNPTQAVMEPGVPAAGILFILMPAVFVLAGPFIIWGSLSGAIVRWCERRGWGYGSTAVPDLLQ